MSHIMSQQNGKSGKVTCQKRNIHMNAIFQEVHKLNFKNFLENKKNLLNQISSILLINLFNPLIKTFHLYKLNKHVNSLQDSSI